MKRKWGDGDDSDNESRIEEDENHVIPEHDEIKQGE